MIGALLAALATAMTPSPEDAQALISAGNFTEAESVIQKRIAAGSRDAESYFLLGLIAMHSQNYQNAIRWFRMALVQDPKSARLRLELGRAFYLAKDYSNAELQFQRALAGNLPPPVQQNARRFLDRIRREKRWSFGFSFALAPDTNINAGSSANEAIIFGLPFQLGPEARMHSGVGIVGDSSIEFSPRLNDRLRWRTGIAARRSEYRGTRFDETIVSGWSGPQWFGKDVEISAEATALWHYYGGQAYQRAVGGRVEAQFYPGIRTALLFGASVQLFNYPVLVDQSGPVWSVTAGVFRTIDPATSVTLLLNGSVQKSHTNDLSNRSGFISLSATRDIKGGFTVTVTPTYGIADYDAADAFFGVVRRDRIREFRAILLNRRAVIWRFTPTVTYTHMRRASSISLYDSRQDRIELGLSSTF